MGNPISDPKVLLNFFRIKREGPRSFTQLSKLGSDTWHYNKLSIEKSLIETPNSQEFFFVHTRRPPAMMAVIAATALMAANPKASAMA